MRDWSSSNVGKCFRIRCDTSLWARSAAWERTCLASTTRYSNNSIPYVVVSMFATIWGICFSLTAKPQHVKTLPAGTVMGTVCALGRESAFLSGAPGAIATSTAGFLLDIASLDLATLPLPRQLYLDLGSDFRCVHLVADSGSHEVRFLRQSLRGTVARAVQIGDERARHKKRLRSAAVIARIRASASFSWSTEFPPQDAFVFFSSHP